MNSVIEAHQEFLEFCLWNWKADRFIRMINYHFPLLKTANGYVGGGRNYGAEKREDEQNFILNKIDRQQRELKLLDQQRL